MIHPYQSESPRFKYQSTNVNHNKHRSVNTTLDHEDWGSGPNNFASLQPSASQQRILKIKRLRASESQTSIKSMQSINHSVNSNGSVVSINRYIDGKPTEFYFKNNEEINQSMESGKIRSSASWFKKRKRELSQNKDEGHTAVIL